MIIYHNPRCSKSRQALAQCQVHHRPQVVEYLKEPPDRACLERILAGLNGDIESMTRVAEVKKAGLHPSLELLVQHPEFIQRPILVDGSRVVVARTPEAVEAFLAQIPQ